MRMIWLQRDIIGRAPVETMAVYRWALMERRQVQWFEPSQLLTGKLALSPLNPVIGSVECVSEALRQLGAVVPEPDYYPDCLRKHLRRAVQRTTVDQARRRLQEGQALFVKSHAWKRFTGQVLGHADIGPLDSLSDTDEVWISEPVRFVSEYRAYILHGQVRGVCQYGEAEDLVLSDRTSMLIAEAAADLMESMPRAAHIVDWGLLADGRLALVEVGDAWAVGLYPGISAGDYAVCLIARWQEMVSQRSANNELTAVLRGRHPVSSLTIQELP